VSWRFCVQNALPDERVNGALTSCVSDISAAIGNIGRVGPLAPSLPCLGQGMLRVEN
jgi:hypothetical protein